MTKRSGAPFDQRSGKVFLLQSIVENEDEESAGGATGNNASDADNIDENDEEMRRENEFNRMRSFTQDNWLELHRQFMLTNAFSDDGRNYVLDYYDATDYYRGYLREEQDLSECIKYMAFLRAICHTKHRRVTLPPIEGHHRSTTLFHLACSAKVDTMEGEIVHDSLDDTVIEEGLAQKFNTSVSEVKSGFNNIVIDPQLEKMLTNNAEFTNVFHDIVDMKVFFFERPADESDAEVDPAIWSHAIERFLIEKSKTISENKLSSAVVPGNVRLAEQLKILVDMLDDGKRNEPGDLIRYTESFGNDSQNPFITEKDKILANPPTYMDRKLFMDALLDPSRENIEPLISDFGVLTTDRPEINNVHPNLSETKKLKRAGKKAKKDKHWIYPPFVLNSNNVLRDPLYRGRQKDLTKGKNKKVHLASYPIDASEVNMVLIVAATAKAMHLAASGKTEAQWNQKEKEKCGNVVKTSLRLLNCTAKLSVSGGPPEKVIKEQMELPGDLRNFVLDFDFAVTHACMFLGAAFNVATYAEDGKTVLNDFTQMLATADDEHHSRGDESVVNVLGENVVFCGKCSRHIRD